MDPVSALEAGAAGVNLVSALAKLIRETKKSPASPTASSLTELLGRLQIDAIGLSRNLENRLRNLVERSQEYGLNPALSMDDHLKDLSWYNVLTRARLKAFREECNAIYRQLTAFLDDATALLLCQERETLAATAFAGSLEIKRQLDQLFLNPQLPIKMILDGMLATATRVTADLQNA